MATRPQRHFSQIAAMVLVLCAIALAACTGNKKQDDPATQSPTQGGSSPTTPVPSY
jgi:hypothetical protein